MRPAPETYSRKERNCARKVVKFQFFLDTQFMLIQIDMRSSHRFWCVRIEIDFSLMTVQIQQFHFCVFFGGMSRININWSEILRNHS